LENDYLWRMNLIRELKSFNLLIKLIINGK
jgi:hypothetical protein